MASKKDLVRWLANRQHEVDSAWQYRAMVDAEPKPEIAAVYRRLAAIEEKHAAFWEQHLRTAGRTFGGRVPSIRARALAWIARRFGAGMILPTVASGEYTNCDHTSFIPKHTARR